MAQILSDFRKAHRMVLLSYWASTALVALSFWLTGIFSKTNTLAAGIVILCVMGGNSLAATIQVLLVTPARFKRSFAALDDSRRQQVESAYPNAKVLGRYRRFMGEYLLYYCGRKIFLLRFDEITATQRRRGGLRLITADGRRLPLPIEPDESCDILLALLKGKGANTEAPADNNTAKGAE